MHFGFSGEDWDKLNDVERQQHILGLRGQLTIFLSILCQQQQLTGKVQIDQTIFEEMVQNYYRDLGRISDTGGPLRPNEFKQKAFYVFWLRKLKPIIMIGGEVDLGKLKGPWLNEYVGFYMALTELDCYLSPQAFQRIDAAFIQDFLVYFRYKSVSPHALYLMFKSLYLGTVPRP